MSRTKAKSTVPTETRLLGNLVFNNKPFWAAMGRTESFFLREELDTVPINSPIYVTGLARSGTTILLEMLAGHSRTAAHAYKDFPMLYTPYWWNGFLKRAAAGGGEQALSERAHKDGIKVGPDSPEAMEEPLWMHFFDQLHDASQNNVLDGATEHAAFSQFYTDHIRKLLLIRSGQRYLAKGNYNLGRIEYLLKLFPDARFVVPVRDPVAHIASLCKQQHLFTELERKDPPVLQHMCRVGHYEFGLNWTPVNYGNTDSTFHILQAWEAGREIEAWALYWNDVHRYLLGLIEKSPALKEAILVVGYEDLCADSHHWVSRIYNHCGLESDAEMIMRYADKLTPPTYYSHGFSEDEIHLIRRLTQDTFERLSL